MKIATWNIERLRHRRSVPEIQSICNQINADILILTETDEQVQLNYRSYAFTPTPPEIILPQFSKPLRYKQTEHRVAIYSNYELVQLRDTYDRYTALCVELETEIGNLLIYGTIIGVLGNRSHLFQTDITHQLADIRRLTSAGQNICICGDYNCSFADNYYFTTEGRDSIRKGFSDNRIAILTEKQIDCVDHISLSEKAIQGHAIQIEEWNQDKRLSDHKGISVSLL